MFVICFYGNEDVLLYSLFNVDCFFWDKGKVYVNNLIYV